MAHGARDFGIYAPKETIVIMEDLGELAVRLGSPVNFDRKGDVVFLDDFEDGISKWDIDLFAGRGSFTWESTYSRFGGFSGLITTGDNNGDELWIFDFIPTPIRSKMGLEVSFTLVDTILDFHFGLWVVDSEGRYYPEVQFVRADDKWQYRDIGGVFQDITPTQPLIEGPPYFHTVKLVFDLTTQYYSHLKVNNTIYDLSSLKFRKRDPVGDDSGLFFIRVKNNAAVEALSYIGHVVVTQNEP